MAMGGIEHRLSRFDVVAWLRFLADELADAKNVNVIQADISLRRPLDVEPLFNAKYGVIECRADSEERKRILHVYLDVAYTTKIQ